MPRIDLVVHRARAVDASGVVDDAWVAIGGGGILATGAGDGWRGLVADAAHDARGATLTPGLVDLHSHGGGGHDYTDGDESAVRAAIDFHRAHGTTATLASLVSDDVPAMRSATDRLARLVPAIPELLGVHLEGPFLAPTRRGAHRPSALAVPTAEAVAELLDGTDAVRMVTIAPELEGGIAAVRRVAAHGAVAAVGHTEADLATAAAAFEAGARALTHAFNAMPGIHHRAPGPVIAATERDDVVLEVILDGHHVHPTVVHGLFRLAPGRVALVTDAMSAAGCADGHYDLGGLGVDVSDGVATLDAASGAAGTLAGSTLTLDAALRGALAAGVDEVAAVAALTAVPADLLGDDSRGRIAVGRRADLVLWNAERRPATVFVGGRRSV